MSESNESLGVLILNVTNTITHVLIGGITTVSCVFAMRFTGHFKQHIILCVIGYILLMGEAILTFNSRNGWSQTLHHKEKKMAHLVIQVAATALVIAGSAIQIHGDGGIHFRGGHAITGILALALAIISFVGGIFNMFLKIRGKWTKVCHSIVGTATVVLAIISLCFGFHKSIFRTWSSDATAITMITFSAILILGTLYSACLNTFKRVVSDSFSYVSL